VADARPVQGTPRDVCAVGSLEEQLATLPQPTAVVSIDLDRVARELRTRADDMRGLLRRQGVHAREVLQTLLVDRVDCTPVLVAGAWGYAFTGDGTFGGLLAASTWPTTIGGPNGFSTEPLSIPFEAVAYALPRAA
jgi:hypothetical protein